MASERTADRLVFFVNGKKVLEKNVDPETTLLTYLRRKLGLCGTKLGCGEGGCGACTVMISKFDNFQNKIIHFSVNACLFPICALHHLAVTTVEGIGSTKTRLHPVQERIAKSHGSQCGFCTPGIVMSIYALLRNRPEPEMEEIEETLQGNLCRCTGYRSILEGYRTFAKDWSHERRINGPACCVIGKDRGCCGRKVNDPRCCMNAKEDNTAMVSSMLFNAAEFQPLDPTQEPIFPPELLIQREKHQKQLCFKGERVMWIQPTTLEELIVLKAQYPNAKLVVGNTEVGIEMRLKNMLYPVIIAPAWIPEMNFVQHTEEGICFGAACTLSSVEVVLKKAVAELPSYKTEMFQAVLEQLRWFAGPQVKNVAALGGNIMTASPISDLNPVFMACGSKLTLVSNEGKRTLRMDEKFFTGYRKTVLKPQEILLSIEMPYTRKHEYFSAFKQASRREDDIAIVTCGMRVLFQEDSNRVQEIKLSYGGMAPTTVLAIKTCQELINREWNDNLLQEACCLLAEEMKLHPSAPGGMVDFRLTLTLSFFFKFFLLVLQKLNMKLNGNNDPDELVSSRYVSATEVFHKDPAASVQLFQEVPAGQSVEDMVGRPLMHLSAAKQACGEAVYCDDIPHYENELYLTLVTSKKAHAKIISIDTTEAQSVPGFVCFISAKDIPGSNVTGICYDETVFADNTVTCVGHIIGGVVADTQEHSRRAARAINIKYEDLSPIITIQEAIEKQSFYNKPSRKIEKGNVQKGFEEADHVIEGEMYIGGQEHFYLETHCTIAVPKGEDGEMELFVSTQSPTHTQKSVASALGVPENRILVRVKRMGGGFGGKESRNTILSTAVAVAAFKTGHPVRCMLDRDEDMLITGGRHPFLGQYKVGFMKNGKVNSLEVSYYSNGGNSTDLSLPIMDRALFHMDNSYNIPNIKGVGVICKTNLSSNTAFRGFGGPQGMMIAECWMSDVILKCGLPAEQVRKLNLYNEGDLTHFNQKLEGFTLQRCWEECLVSSEYYARKTLIDEFNRQNRWRKRGIAIIPTKFGISFTLSFLNQAGALVHVYTDGSVLLTHGGTEMGQGLHTKMIQVASRTLGIPTAYIHINETSTNTVPNTSATAASVSTDLNGMAVSEACQTILKRLEPFKRSKPKGSWKDWVEAAYVDCVSLSATGFYRTPGIHYDYEKNEGKPFNYFSYGVACSEVEIDCLTGDHKNLRTDVVMDVGTSLNPAIDIGQIEGAFVQGLGLFTMEELRYSPEGELYTQGPGTYKIPAFGDIPTEFHVSLLRDCPNSKAIYSSKAVGEPPLFLSASVFYAIKDAIFAARTESGLTEPFRLDSPATPERICNACVDTFTKLCPSAEPGTFTPWSVRV